MPLNQAERSVVFTKTMRYTEKEALAYLKKKGHKMDRNQYYRIWGTVSTETRKRLFEICKNMKERHMERIDDVEMIRTQLLDVLKEPKLKTENKLRTLHELRELQQWISAYDESAQGVLEDFVKNFGQEDKIVDISSLEKEFEKTG